MHILTPSDRAHILLLVEQQLERSTRFTQMFGRRRDKGGLPVANSEHHGILDAIELGQKEAASRLLHAHIEHSSERVHKLLEPVLS